MNYHHFCLLFLMMAGVYSFQDTKPSRLSLEIPAQQAAKWRWTEACWTTRGDVELHKIRGKLEALFADDKPHTDLVARSKQASQQAPKDKVKLFEWGYATCLMALNDPPTSTVYLFGTRLTNPVRRTVMNSCECGFLQNLLSSIIRMIIWQRLENGLPEQIQKTSASFML